MASKFLNLSTDTTLGGNAPSDEIVSSQKAIKAYVDNHSGGGGGSYTAGDGIDITNDVISVGDIDCGEIATPQKTVTFLVDNYVDFDNIIVNGVTYAQSVFGEVAGGVSGSIMTLSLSFDIGTSIVWSITTNGDATPSSGSFVLNNDTTVNIVVYYGGGGEGGKE